MQRNFYLIWITLLLAFWIPLLDDSFWNNGESYDKLISAIYYPFCRIIWSLCIALLIWLCISGNGGLINKFLSWKGFVPLARLTYSVYLTHAWIIWTFYGSRRERIDLSSYSLVNCFQYKYFNKLVKWNFKLKLNIKLSVHKFCPNNNSLKLLKFFYLKYF
jgi:hypothetical protein